MPIHQNKRFEIEVKHRPAVPDNIKYWQVFDDDIYTTQKENWRKIQNLENQQQVPIMEIISDLPKVEDKRFWNLDFDGAVSKEGAGAGVWIIGPNHFSKTLSIKLYFDCTNNMAEYEAFIIGL